MVNDRRQKIHQQYRISRSAFSLFLYFFLIKGVYFKVLLLNLRFTHNVAGFTDAIVTYLKASTLRNSSFARLLVFDVTYGGELC